MKNLRRTANWINNIKRNSASVPKEIRQEYLAKKKEETAEVLNNQSKNFPLERCVSWESSFAISPQRWGTISSLILEGVEIFYNDPVKRNDLSQSLREWYFMWPQAGPFSVEENQEYGYQLKQHWFLRDNVWKKKRLKTEAYPMNLLLHQKHTSNFLIISLL